MKEDRVVVVVVICTLFVCNDSNVDNCVVVFVFAVFAILLVLNIYICK